MKIIFYVSLLLYCYSHFCLFSPSFTGLEIDFSVGMDILQNRIPNAEDALLFTIRGLVNSLVLILYLLSNQSLYIRLQSFLDLRFLIVLIALCLLLLTGFLLFFAPAHLAFGALMWAFSALMVVGSLYQWTKTTAHPYVDLKPLDHLVANDHS